jgi:hypothetical protein
MLRSEGAAYKKERTTKFNNEWVALSAGLFIIVAERGPTIVNRSYK